MDETPDTPAEQEEDPKIDAIQAKFAVADVRLKVWAKQRESILNLLKYFQQSRVKEAGTRELSYYLGSRQISEAVQMELMPDPLKKINTEEMSLIMKRCETLSSKALSAKTPATVPLTRANGDSDTGKPASASSNGDSDSGKPASALSNEVMDTTVEDVKEQSETNSSVKDDTKSTRSSRDPGPATPPRRGRTPPRTKRPSTSSGSTRNETSTKTVVGKPGYKTMHYQYSTPKHGSRASDRTARSRDDSCPGSRSTSKGSPPPGSSTPRGKSKRKDGAKRSSGN